MVMLRNIMEGRYTFTSPEWDDITGKHTIVLNADHQSSYLVDTDAPKDLISKLLVVDPKRRFTVEDALKHEFFQVLVSRRLLFLLSCTHSPPHDSLSHSRFLFLSFVLVKAFSFSLSLSLVWRTHADRRLLTQAL